MIGMVEYIVLRIARRTIPKCLLGIISKFTRYYKPNTGMSDPNLISSKYVKLSENSGKTITGKNILEIGCGATNGTGYFLVSHGASRWYGFDPYSRFDIHRDKQHLSRIPGSPGSLQTKAVRIKDLDDLGSGSIDVIFSNSVLEHVSDPKQMFTVLEKKLNPDGFMIHSVDYRDHFFKYPYHFLLFGKRTWNLFLNPGDLYRYRMCDHINAMQSSGFRVTVLSCESNAAEFSRIRTKVHPDFVKYSESDLQITEAVVLAEKPT